MLDQKTTREIKKIVFHYLDPKRDKIFIFGSRAIGEHRKFSDIDLGIESKRKIPALIIEDLKEALEESDIPFTIDVVNFTEVSSRFRSVAKQKIIYLN
ncbi:hypothetical protein A2866_06775 [Candidatus Roizmanbacteria bacterium RIFCSPHIGHO2_01_FULL_39_8]|uniref:Polymerase beta nucleotidyltransferase domain-containing protein n=1 Tax=Candidatus Roizmanbacteria bacterium RIFCSPHIGHO2_01_FULL_39_8 TaxID=1802033 RepID=A0A1F7GTN6_9BACT|nr:MAG: hypothetical protein A2866_06775 [Candidatus Roizmanbacteria bacterium RIFCSPHIGHO2_01_FULL_39_8]